MTNYYIGIKFKNLPTKLHMTLAFCGKLTDSEFKNIQENLKQISYKLLPLTVSHLYEFDYFGKKEDIKVLKCNIDDDDKLIMIKELYKKYADKTDQFYDLINGPHLHISLHNCEDIVLSHETFEANLLYIKAI